METIITSGSLILTSIMMLLVNVLGYFEYTRNMPKWFANPPISFNALREHTKKAQQRWIPIQILFMISFVTALITNWQSSPTSLYLIFAGVIFIAIVISTVLYFAPEVIAFSKIPMDAPKTDELLQRCKKWYSVTIFRNALQLLMLILILIATYRNLAS